MEIFEELSARGLLAQFTNEEKIKEVINNGKATFYIGFDPTADSLHVGHFMALCLMKRLQMAGNKPIALVGGGTGMIGDPSGRTRAFGGTGASGVLFLGEPSSGFRRHRRNAQKQQNKDARRFGKSAGDDRRNRLQTLFPAWKTVTQGGYDHALFRQYQPSAV